MKLPAIALVAVVLINISNSAALACGPGGYRPAARAYAPQFYRAPVQRVIVHQPVRTIRTIAVAAPRPIVTATPQSSTIRLAPTQLSRVKTQPTQRLPQNSTVAQAVPQPSPQQENLSALALLMGESSQASTQTIVTSTSTTPSKPRHLGTWRATTAGNATVSLTLNGDTSFSWTAVSNGKTTQFDGSFTLADGKLTLARGSDNQKLTGDFSFSNSGFNFKLAGAKDAGLNFTR